MTRGQRVALSNIANYEGAKMTQNVRVWQAEMLPVNQENIKGQKTTSKNCVEISFIHDCSCMINFTKNKKHKGVKYREISENGKRTWKISGPRDTSLCTRSMLVFLQVSFLFSREIEREKKKSPRKNLRWIIYSKSSSSLTVVLGNKYLTDNMTLPDEFTTVHGPNSSDKFNNTVLKSKFLNLVMILKWWKFNSRRINGVV